MAATKLTLTVEEGVIERMKEYANTKHSSVSRIVENYFVSLTSQNIKRAHDRIAVSPFIENLSIEAVGVALPENFDAEKAIVSYLEEKYK